MKRFVLIILGLIFAYTLSTGCGGTTASSLSAPPVSLPAPVTGRITVSSPDDDGDVTIVGEEGSVSASSFVMAINEDTDVVSASLFRFPFSFASAHAQSDEGDSLALIGDDGFNTICQRTTRACGQADDTGAFTIKIPAAIDHTIAVVEYDNDTGFEKSERLSKGVPKNAKVLKRAPLGIAANETTNVLYIKQQGLEDSKAKTDAQKLGQLAIVDLNNSTTNLVDLPTKGVGKIALNEAGNFLVMTDVSNGFVSIGTVDSTSFTETFAFGHTGALHIDFNSSGLAVIGSVENKSGLLLVDMNTNTTSSTDNDFKCGSAPGKRENFEAFDFVTVGTKNIGVMVGQHQDNDGKTLACISTFRDEGDTLTVAPSGVFTDFTQSKGTGLFFDATTSFFADVEIFNSGQNVMVSDRKNNQILVFDLAFEEVDNPSFIVGGTAKLTLDLPLLVLKTIIPDPSGLVVGPREIEIDETLGLAFVAVWNRTDEHPDSVLVISLSTLKIINQVSAGLAPRGVKWVSSDQQLYIGAQQSGTLIAHPLSVLNP